MTMMAVDFRCAGRIVDRGEKRQKKRTLFFHASDTRRDKREVVPYAQYRSLLNCTKVENKRSSGRLRCKRSYYLAQSQPGPKIFTSGFSPVLLSTGGNIAKRTCTARFRCAAKCTLGKFCLRRQFAFARHGQILTL